MTDTKKYALIALIAFPVVALVSVLITRLDQRGTEPNVRNEAIAILNEPIDFSQTLYPEEDRPLVVELLNKERADLESAPAVEWETLANLASMYKDIRDYQHALELYALLDRVNPPDKFYKLERGMMYLAMGNAQQSVSEIQPLKQEWPIPETFTALADAYKQLEGTPHYVIDDIYEEGIFRHNSQFDIVWEYIRWLEETDRESETIEYYEQIYAQNQDPAAKQKIDELKEKYG